MAYVTSITTSAYQTRENSRFLSYPELDNLSRIRISIPGFNPGSPYMVCKFVCVEILRPSQPNGVMSSAVSLPNHTFIGQA